MNTASAASSIRTTTSTSPSVQGSDSPGMPFQHAGNSTLPSSSSSTASIGGGGGAAACTDGSTPNKRQMLAITAAGESLETPATSIHSFPNEVLLEIFSKLDSQSLFQAFSTCRAWRYVICTSTRLGIKFPRALKVASIDDYIRSVATLPEIHDLSIVPAITTADLSAHYRHLTDTGIRSLAKGCPNLQVLNLSMCSKLSDAAVIDLVNDCPNLTKVDLEECDQITDAVVIALATGFPKLREVDLGYCEQITDAAVKALAKGHRKLTKVKLSGCDKLTDAAIKALAKGCPSLKEVDLSECDYLSDAAVKALAKG
ncbi:hypothetical protein DID77_04355 [Candidatus Marinamargulisbacteria bacterium SCGC AG-439-L15]|nr:hypothetical protein DID77_04355 [Candidatus Marinamargulisbacteria bacterium SCGC AG-439-L15]